MAVSAPVSRESRVVFAGGSENFTVREVIDAAHFRGELETAWQEFLVRAEAERLARDAGAELDSDELDSAAVAFRYQYDLITAEETEAWLEARNLTLADFSEYFGRQQWSQTFGGRAKPAALPFHAASAEQRDLFAIDLTLAGALDETATRLAWRVAALEAAKEADAALIETERQRFHERTGLTPPEVAEWLRGLGRDQDWLERSLAWEAAYRARCEKVLTREARERELSSLRLPLTRFRVEMIELESRDAAMEAFMCVRDDGMSMADVAKEGRYPFHETEMVLEQISEDLQQKFLSLPPGSLLEPTAREDGFLLTRILEKKEPTLADADVLARVEQRIRERHFAGLTSSRIQWRISLTGLTE